jgi:flagellar capping protein FliD
MDIIPNNASMFNSLQQLGFVIAGDGDITITRKGLLMIDSTDLDEIKQAIRDNSTIMGNLINNSDDVHMFFSQTREIDDPNDTSTPRRQIRVEDSWTRRYERMLSSFTDIEGAIGSRVRVDSALDRQLRNINREIERQTLRAESYLEMLWRQFTHMETRVNAINNQSQYIMALAQQAMGGGGGGR